VRQKRKGSTFGKKSGGETRRKCKNIQQKNSPTLFAPDAHVSLREGGVYAKGGDIIEGDQGGFGLGENQKLAGSPNISNSEIPM